jgi:hypothetical protein
MTFRDPRATQRSGPEASARYGDVRPVFACSIAVMELQIV